MSGKSYSLREMKTIVDYLVEHKAYNEYKGRKMWMDFAGTRLTNRTWQSLKETFLKRILPDITNPYYRLDVNQIHSFKRGINLADKDKNKLELQPVDEKTNNNDAKGDNEQPSTSNNTEGNATGEDTTCSKLVHNRASTETLILENCYETAEDIQRDLERSTDNEQEDKEKPQTKPPVKSVRDFIVYSEPLTPMLQEVLDDFASDEESDRMLIDENYVGSERRSNSPENIVASQSILKPKNAVGKAKPTSEDSEEITKDAKKVEENNKQSKKDTEKQVTENHDELEKNIEAGSLSQFEDVMVMVDKALAKHLGCEMDKQNESLEKVVELDSKLRNSNEASSGLTDSLLPNNQEAVNSETFPNASPILPTPTHVNGDQASKKRKRSNSTEILEANKTKKQKEPEQSIADRKQSDAVEIVVVNVATKVDADDEPSSDTNKKVDQNNIDGPKAVDAEKRRDKSPSLSLKKKHNLTMNSTKSSKKQNEPNPTTSQIISSDSSDIIVSRSAQLENPCLKSVSLYAEQFSSTKYSDSDINIVEDDGKEKNSNKPPEPNFTKFINVATKEKAEDVILLRSRSNSASDSEPPLSAMKQRRNKIAKIFGLTNGGGSQSRRMNGRKRTSSHRAHQYISSESSDWTSASDSEFVSPPRGRRNRYARKYLKPQSARVMSLEGGGLFVMLGKKIFPLTKHGRTVKNYLTYSPDSEEEEDSYWKNKYVEERKRTAELKKTLQKSKQNDVQIVEEPESSVEVSPLPQVQRQQRQSIAKESVDGNELVTRKETAIVIPDKPSEEKTLKIKFTKNDQEIQLEGHWQHINPVLAQVVSMFHTEPVAAKQPDPANCVELSSGTTTPRPLAVDTGVKEKINKIESDIFKEIVQKDVEEVQSTPEENASKDAVEKDSHVTVRKRRGRAKKQTSLVVTRSSSRSTERSLGPETKLDNIEKEQGNSDSTPSVTSERRTRTPRKLLEVATAAATKQVNRRKASPAKVTENEDEEVFYKFPSPLKRGKKPTSVTNNAIETAKHSKQITSPNNSINSNQGYQDSDTSPFNIGTKKKRRFSVSTLSLKGRQSRRYRSKSYPHLVDYETSESSNSSFSISVKSVTQSTLNSEVHKSESYQLLMPRTKKIMEALEKIEEATATTNNFGNVTNRTMSISNLSVEIEVSEEQVPANSDVASSSNVSLPPSPELSIVENISVSRSTLATEDYPTINEMQSEVTADPSGNKYVMSEVDVSMPLMAQECSLRKHLMSVINDLTDLKNAPKTAGQYVSTPDLSAQKMSSISESILNEIRSVSIEPSLSDSLDRRLEQLLLESAQKSTAIMQEKMEVDTQTKKNTRSKKRSSTPNKRKAIQKKTKVPEVSIVEEECKAHCAHTGRRSCPPSINIIYHEGDVPDNLQINIHEQTTPHVAPIAKRKSVKKDIIKVKILKPKKKPEPKKKSPKTRTSNIVCDESGVFLQGFDDSADLIHNHSESCLHTKDCMRDAERDSVEFIETTSLSIISLNSSASQSKENLNVNIIEIEDGQVTPELFCDNAQCAANLQEAKAIEARSPETGNTQYFTPVSPNSSMLTEDLSDEAPTEQPAKTRPTKWYLLSEEDTTNTNYFDSYQDESNDVRSYGANLQQLFPITCAVPNLSTITEMSNFNSPNLGVQNLGDTDFDSQCMN